MNRPQVMQMSPEWPVALAVLDATFDLLERDQAKDRDAFLQDHGAFNSVLALATIMYAQSLSYVPERVTGVIGATLIGLSLYSYLRHNKMEQGTWRLYWATELPNTLKKEIQ